MHVEARWNQPLPIESEVPRVAVNLYSSTKSNTPDLHLFLGCAFTQFSCVLTCSFTNWGAVFPTAIGSGDDFGRTNMVFPSSKRRSSGSWCWSAQNKGHKGVLQAMQKQTPSFLRIQKNELSHLCWVSCFCILSILFEDFFGVDDGPQPSFLRLIDAGDQGMLPLMDRNPLALADDCSLQAFRAA